MRLSHSCSATVISIRAKFEPMQRWMPSPKAACRFSLRSITTRSASGNTRGIAVRGGEREQHHLARLHRAAVDRRVLDHLARHRDRRIGAQELLDRGRDQLRLVDEAAPVFRVLREVPEARADRAPGGVDARDQDQPQRAEQMIFADRLPVDLGRRKLADQVVASARRGAFPPRPGNTCVVSPIAFIRMSGRVMPSFEDLVDPLAEAVALALPAGPA